MDIPESPNTVAALQPGDVVELTSLSQLPKFEDLVADVIDPDMAERFLLWAGRASITRLITPNGYNGPIGPLRLTVMSDAYERLFGARNEGWKFTRPGGVPNNRSQEQKLTQSFWCFLLEAVKHPRKGDPSQQIQTLLWYGHVPYIRHTGPAQQDGTAKVYFSTPNVQGGASVQRYVTVPKTSAEPLQPLPDTVRRIGFEALRDAVCMSGHPNETGSPE